MKTLTKSTWMGLLVRSLRLAVLGAFSFLKIFILLYLFLGFIPDLMAEEWIVIRPEEIGIPAAPNTAYQPQLAFDEDDNTTNAVLFSQSRGVPELRIDLLDLVVGTRPQPYVGAISSVTMVVVHNSFAGGLFFPESVQVQWRDALDPDETGELFDLNLSSEPEVAVDEFDITSDKKWTFDDFSRLGIHARLQPAPFPPVLTYVYNIHGVYFRVKYNPFVIGSAKTRDYLTDTLSHSSGTPTGVSVLGVHGPAAPEILFLRRPNGRLDAVELRFSRPILYSSVCPSAPGFSLFGYGPVKASTSCILNGTTTYICREDDQTLFLKFDEIPSGTDTDAFLALSYTRPSGDACAIQSTEGDLLENFEFMTVDDGAGPIVLEARAVDQSGGGHGIDQGDTVVVRFNEGTRKPLIDSSNIEFFLPPNSPSYDWLSGDRRILGATWSPGGETLTVALSTSGGLPRLEVGSAKICLGSDPWSIMDWWGNAASGEFCQLLTGDFGDDRPDIVSRETADLDSNGILDALRIRFNKAVCDASVNPDDWTVISGNETLALNPFHSRPPGSGDVPNDSEVYLTFNENRHSVGTDEKPYIVFGGRSIVEFIPGLPGTGCGRHRSLPEEGTSVDKASPVLVSAESSGEGVFIPELDEITLTFSEPTNRPQVDSSNINSLFPINSGARSWGSIHSLWKDSKTLVIKFGPDTSSCTLKMGSRIEARGGNTLTDLESPGPNSAKGTVVLNGRINGNDRDPPEILSIYPNHGDLNVIPGAAIRVQFSKRMDTDSTTRAVELIEVRDRNAKTLDTPVPVQKTMALSQDTLVITPVQALQSNFTYRLKITTLAKDSAGNSLRHPHVVVFSTLLDRMMANRILSSDGTELYIEQGALPSSGYIRISDPLVSPSRVNPAGILDANEKMNQSRGAFSLPLVIREFDYRSDQNQMMSGELSGPVLLSIPLPDNYPQVQAESVRMFYLDERTNLWNLLPGSRYDAASRRVSVSIPHFSVYGLAVMADSDLGAVYAYPVPFRGDRGDAEITFSHLSARAAIRIFTVTGELVRQLDNTAGGPTMVWDVKNGNGENVASGTYLYIVENENDSKKGKLMVIR